MTADVRLATGAPTLQRSPLAAHAEVMADGSRPGTVSLREMGLLAMVSLRLRDDAARRACAEAIGVDIPTRAGTAADDGVRSVLWIGPDEWLVVGPPGDDAALLTALSAATEGVHASVVVVSSAATTLELSGPAARDVLEGSCRLDLHPRAFGPGSCAATTVAQAAVVIHQTGHETYRLVVRSSFARHLADWLLDGMREHTG